MQSIILKCTYLFSNMIFRGHLLTFFAIIIGRRHHSYWTFGNKGTDKGAIGAELKHKGKSCFSKRPPLPTYEFGVELVLILTGELHSD